MGNATALVALYALYACNYGLGAHTPLLRRNNSTHADIMAMKAGAAGAAEAIKLILTGVLNGKAANPLFRDAVGGNFTMVLNALNDLNS